jgi:hypothetical protein
MAGQEVINMKCPFCDKQIGDEDSRCPHCGAGQDGLTEEQITVLKGKIHDNYLNTLTIVVFIGGLSLAIGCIGIYIGMIGPAVVGFVLLVITLVIGSIFLGKARDSDRVLARWEEKEVEGNREEEEEKKSKEDIQSSDLHIRRVRRLKRRARDGQAEELDKDQQ